MAWGKSFLISWHAAGSRGTPKQGIDVSSLIRWILSESVQFHLGEKGKSGLVECLSNKVVTQGDALSLIYDPPSVII